MVWRSGIEDWIERDLRSSRRGTLSKRPIEDDVKSILHPVHVPVSFPSERSDEDE